MTPYKLLIGLVWLPTVLYANTLISPEIITYQVHQDFETVKFNLETAILDRGLTLNNTLHLSDMLQRTGKDLGFSNSPYTKAEALEFCSAVMAHRLTQAHPLNIVNCPFTITLYSTTPQQVTLAFRKPLVAGDSQLAQELETWLRKIAQAAIKE